MDSQAMTYMVGKVLVLLLGFGFGIWYSLLLFQHVHAPGQVYLIWGISVFMVLIGTAMPTPKSG